MYPGSVWSAAWRRSLEIPENERCPVIQTDLTSVSTVGRRESDPGVLYPLRKSRYRMRGHPRRIPARKSAD